MLKVLGKELKKGCICAFITKKEIDDDILINAGFLVEDTIIIGVDSSDVYSNKNNRKNGNSNLIKREEISLNSLKKNKKRENNRDFGIKKNTGDCFITFAVTSSC